jgi:deaminated glutathione amidase
VRIALCQLTSTPAPAANLELVADYATRAAAQGAELAVFPEATMACFGIPLGPVAQPLDGPWASRVAEIARTAGLTVVAGMFTPSADGRVRNTLLHTDGEHSTHYDKIHLFDAFGFAESRTVAPGDHPVTVGPLGLATCYDIRFPTLFQALADRGALVITVPTSWGAGPGKLEQWQVLVRARALDATCWVVACGQADPAASGSTAVAGAPTGIGHSMVVDPFGRVVVELGAEPELVVVDIDPDEVDRARAALPVLANRRALA